MSSVVISGDTSGAITLAAPAVSGTNTATLPAATGTVMVSGNMPAFSAWCSTAQALTQNAYTKIAIDTKEFDTASCFNTSTYRFTPNVAGYYQVNANYNCTASGVTLALIYKNGSSIKSGANSSATAVTGGSVSALMYLNGSTDYIEFYGYTSAAGNYIGNASTYTYFQASMVRAA